MSDAPAWPKPGMIVSFLANADTVALGLPQCDSTKKVCCFCGTVVGVAPIAPVGPGKVPSAAVKIRGQSGRVVTIDGAACYLEEHPTLAEAKARPVPPFP